MRANLKQKSASRTADKHGAMSSHNASDAYLRDAVLTATPEQLHLMLYDGAIRFARQGRDALARKDYDTSYEKLSRAQKIVLEMQNALNYDVNRDLCTRMASLYDFVYFKLVDANIHFKTESVDDALKILEHQRETWAMLLDKLKEERTGAAPASPASVASSSTPPRTPPSRTSPRQASPPYAESTLCVEG